MATKPFLLVAFDTSRATHRNRWLRFGRRGLRDSVFEAARKNAAREICVDERRENRRLQFGESGRDRLGAEEKIGDVENETRIQKRGRVLCPL